MSKQNETKKIHNNMIGNNKLPSEQVEDKQVEMLVKDIIRKKIDPVRKETLKETFKKASKSDKKPYSIRLSEFLMEDVEKYSNLMNINKSDLINDLLKKHLENRLLERTQIHFYFQFYEKSENVHLIRYLDRKNSSNMSYMEQYTDLIGYNEDQGLIYLEEIPLNNFLDNWENGTYKAKSKNDHYHEGLLTSTRRDKYYYVLWHLTENILLHNTRTIIIRNLNKFIKIEKLEEISKKEAIELALDRNNTKLIKAIENNEIIRQLDSSLLDHQIIGSRDTFNEDEFETAHDYAVNRFSSQVKDEIIKDFENKLDEKDREIKKVKEDMKQLNKIISKFINNYQI